jgi:hypothetical protein
MKIEDWSMKNEMIARELKKMNMNMKIEDWRLKYEKWEDYKRIKKMNMNMKIED